MKRFKDFINENKEDENSFPKFLEEVKKAFMKDFHRDTTEEADAFISQYAQQLKDSWDNGFTVREAIAATKIPGTMITVAKTDESYIFGIDSDFEDSFKVIENMNVNNLDQGEKLINDYYYKYYRKPFSDVRISERLKNNYKTLIQAYEQKINELS